jgi:trimeric autotransporter adhesin
MKHFKSILIIIVFQFTTVIQAQVGIDTPTPQGALDITSSNDGLLIPRVALTITTSALPLIAPTTSELVYNSASVADVTPGFYYWNGTIWVRLGAGVTNDWSITGNTGIIDGTNYIGTAALTNVDVAFRRNNLAAGKIGSTSTSFGLGALTFGAASNSSAFGNNALANNTSGSGNVAFGTSSLSSISTGSNNTGVGFNSLLANSASNNSAFGYRTLAANTTGTQNVAVGYNALQANTLGNDNVAVGYQSLLSNTNSLRNTAIGFRAMASINSAGWSENVAIGWQAMADADTNVTNCTFIGVQAGRRNNGNNSVGIGKQALGSNNGGPSSGIDNVAIGNQSLSFNTTGQQNAVVGVESMPFSTTGRENSVLGYRSGYNITTGNQNTAIGYRAGSNTTTGSGNVFIGYFAGQAELNTSSNKLYISNSASSATTSLLYGEFGPSRILRTNSLFQIGDPAGTGYVFPVARGTNSQILQSDASGILSWVAPTSLSITETDPQVSSITANRIPKWNGTSLIDGVVTDDGTNVGIGTSPSVGNKLEVAGNIKTTNFQMTIGATANYFLKSDAAGNASWATIPVNTVKPYVTTGLISGIYTILLTEYTIRVFNAVSEVRVPNAAGNTGKIYIIIGSNTISSKILSTSGGSIYDDVTNTFINTINANERYTVQSDGSNWIVIGR